MRGVYKLPELECMFFLGSCSGWGVWCSRGWSYEQKKTHPTPDQNLGEGFRVRWIGLVGDWRLSSEFTVVLIRKTAKNFVAGDR